MTKAGIEPRSVVLEADALPLGQGGGAESRHPAGLHTLATVPPPRVRGQASASRVGGKGVSFKPSHTCDFITDILVAPLPGA